MDLRLLSTLLFFALLATGARAIWVLIWEVRDFDCKTDIGLLGSNIHFEADEKSWETEGMRNGRCACRERNFAFLSEHLREKGYELEKERDTACLLDLRGG